MVRGSIAFNLANVLRFANIEYVVRICGKDTWYVVSGTWQLKKYQVPSTKYYVLPENYQVPSTTYHVVCGTIEYLVRTTYMWYMVA